jgi:hypothetical protein
VSQCGGAQTAVFMSDHNFVSMTSWARFVKYEDRQFGPYSTAWHVPVGLGVGVGCMRVFGLAERRSWDAGGFSHRFDQGDVGVRRLRMRWPCEWRGY